MNPAASPFNLTGKAAIVTGASYGLGVTMAETLAQAGARVALVARSADKLQRVAENIKQQGGTAEVVPCDVGDSAQVANMVATVLQKFGHVAAIRPRSIAVDSAGQAATKATQLGGTLIMPPFDVMDLGRMAVIQDPTGAHFCVWQARKNTGIGIAGVAGSLCWADLSTPDAKRAGDFYSGLFGWCIMADEKDKSGYL